MNKTKTIALYGILSSLALILSYVETQIPAFIAIPGMKLGLTNIVVLVALYHMDEKAALIINFVRIIIVALLFGTALSFAFSLAGGLLSGLVMILMKKTDRFGVMGVSTVGALTHNIGQILVAMIALNTRAIAWYLPVLWITGVITGLIIGFIGAMVIKKLPAV
ncbi:MAG: Gx transporter family protein [Butyrivibrio sp.]|nr:Gx transporter family protein [Butyrivibrio sp.]